MIFNTGDRNTTRNELLGSRNIRATSLKVKIINQRKNENYQHKPPSISGH